MPITHPFRSGKPDDPDASLVRSSNWDAAHVGSITSADVSDFTEAAQLHKKRHAVFMDFESFNSWPLAPTQSGVGASASLTGVLIANANQIGMRGVTTGTDATGRASLRAEPTSIRLGNGDAIVEASVAIQTLSTATERFIFRFGFFDSDTGDAIDGVYLEYDDSLSLNWRVCTASNSIRTKTISTTVVTTETLTLKVVVNAAGTSASYFVNDVELSGSPITTNIPTGVGRETGWGYHIIKSVGLTARAFHTDWFYHDFNLIVSRATTPPPPPPPPPSNVWISVSPGAGAGIVDLKINSADIVGLLAYCAVDVSGGPQRSVDGGINWTDKIGPVRISSGASNVNAMQHIIAPDPSDVNRVYVSYWPTGCLATSVFNKEGVYISTNQGDTWTHRTAVESIALQGGTLACDFAGRLMGFVPNSTTMYVSSDQGILWATRTAPFLARARDYDTNCNITSGGLGSMVAVVSHTTNRLFYADPMSSTKGMHFTDNQGVSWTEIISITKAGRTISDLVVNPSDSNRVICVTRNNSSGNLEIWVSSDNGATFAKDTLELVQDAVGQNARGVVAMNRAGVAIAWPVGIFKSTRPGARSTSSGALGTWSTYVPTSSAGTYAYLSLGRGTVQRLYAYPAVGVTRWIAVTLASAMTCIDTNANTWLLQGRGIVGANNKTFVVDSTNPNRLLLGVRDVGMTLSTDAGASWQDVNGNEATSFPDCYGACQDPTLNTRFYRFIRVPSNDPQCAFQESTDQGLTWTTLSTPAGFAVGSSIGPQVSIIVDPLNADIIYVGWSKDSPGVEGLYRSTNRGTSFTLVPNSNEVSACILVGRHIYGFTAFDVTGSGGELFKFNIDTNVWTKLRDNALGDVNGFAVKPNDDQTMWVCQRSIPRVINGSATKGNLYKTINGGGVWTLQQKAILDFTPTKIEYVDPNNSNRMMMGTYYEDPAGTFHGIMQSGDNGTTWTDMTSQLGQAQLTGRGFFYGGIANRYYAMTSNSGLMRIDGLVI